jgi:hypothetical protein
VNRIAAIEHNGAYQTLRPQPAKRAWGSSSLARPEDASVSSDPSAQKDCQIEVTGAGTGAPEDVRQLGSNPVVPTKNTDSSLSSIVESCFSFINDGLRSFWDRSLIRRRFRSFGRQRGGSTHPSWGGISAHTNFARHTVKRAERSQIQTVACRSLVWTGCPGNRWS